MNLAKALKHKNQLVGEINKLRTIVQSENVQLNSNKSRFDVPQAYAEYEQKLAELVDLKAALAVANADIWKTIFTVVELKGQIAFLQQVGTREGTFEEGAYGQKLTNVYTPALNAKYVQDEILRLEKQIVDLQDTVDAYNHQTTI